MTSNTFAATGLSPVILAALDAVSLVTPTPIQEQAIPIGLENRDVIGIAQTGTGKTLAFSLPLLQKLRTDRGRGLILVPTRELALQVEESIQKVASKLNPRVATAVLIGGAPIRQQIAALRQNPRIIIATPGRLQDHIGQRTVNLSDVNTLILDEADRMLDMGFHRQIVRILESVPAERQTMLFSATMSPEITKLAAQYMFKPERIEASRQGTPAEQIEQQLCYVGPDRKPEVLELLLLKHHGPVLVFSRTKHGAAKLSRHLLRIGYEAAEIHSNKSLNQRRSALDGFKSGKYRVLVATDIAARGIDVQNIELVVNYDLPDVAEDYVHRIGRTGRAGKKGLAISLASHDQYKDVATIEHLMNVSLPLHEHSETRQAMRATSAAPGGRGRTGGTIARVNRDPRQGGGNGGSRRPQQGARDGASRGGSWGGLANGGNRSAAGRTGGSRERVSSGTSWTPIDR